MNTSRFSGVAAAARALGIGGAATSGTTTIVAAEDPAPAPAADPALTADPADPVDPTPTPDPAPADSDPAPDPQAAPAPAPAPEAAASDAPTAAASERARVNAVFASEHANGRERQAADMLSTSATADEIIGCLAKAPKGGAAAADMLAALAADQNPDLGAGAAEPADKAKAADEVWGRLWAKPATQR